MASHERARLGGSIEIGLGSYGRPKVNYYKGDVGRVVIGRYCSIAADVQFTPGGEHRLDWITTYPIARLARLGPNDDSDIVSKGNIEVGNDVWIGKGARILSGVTIGDGAVIGANAVVASPVRPYAIVVGNPAHEVRRRFADGVVDALLDIAWWNWPEGKIREHHAMLESADVSAFIARFRRSSGK